MPTKPPESTEGSTAALTSEHTTDTTDITGTGNTNTTGTSAPTLECLSAELPEPTGGPPEICPERPATDACCCFAADPEHGTVESVCGVEPLCPGIELECPGPIHEHCVSENLILISDVATIDCALQALEAGKTGRISWDIEIDAGFYRDHVVLDLAGDGTVFRHGFYSEDLFPHWHAVERRNLPTRSYFATCLEAPAWQTRFECIRRILGCSELQTCLAGAECPWSIECSIMNEM